MKFPVCVFATVSAGRFGKMVVESVALALADPPPVTLTVFICGDVALPATLIVTVIGG